MNLEENTSQTQYEQPGQPVSNLDSFRYYESLPYSTGILVMGILSIFTCCCFGGVPFGAVALVLAFIAGKMHRADPMKYSITSVNNYKAGKTCAIIGLVLSVLFLVLVLTNKNSSSAWYNTYSVEEYLDI